MPQDLVLLTGATGFVGFRVLTELLDQNYKVRLAVRSAPKIAAIRRALPTRYTAYELEFVVIPDFAIEDAFEGAITGVKYVIHVAAPVPAPSKDYEATMIKPSVGATLSILCTALKHPEVRKVVITSSVAAILPGEPRVFDADNVEPDPVGPYNHPFFAYGASKTLALNAARRFVAERSPKFDVIHIMPSFVVGPYRFATHRESYERTSNRIALSVLLGRKFPERRPGIACHVDDVAAVHVTALRAEVQGHQNFGVSFDGPKVIEWNTAAEIVKRRLPDLVEQGIFPLGGSVETQTLHFRAEKTEQVLGMRFKSFEEMVVDLARAYSQLRFEVLDT